MRLFLVLCLVCLIGFGCKEDNPTTPDNTPKEGPLVGNLAPSFTIPDHTGKDIRLKDYRGKVVLLEFWNSHCQTCVDEMPDLERLWHEKRSDTNFVLIGISGNEFESEWREYISAKETGSGYPRDWIQVWNKLWDIAKKYNVDGTPRRILIDRKGVIVDNYIYTDEMKAKVDAELAKK